MKLKSIMLISMVLILLSAGFSSAIQIAELEISTNNETLRVDLQADCKPGKETELVYVDSASIILEKIDITSNKVVEELTLVFIETTIEFGMPACIYKTDLAIEDEFKYRISVASEGYKKTKEEYTAQELKGNPNGENEYLQVIKIEKRLINNQEKEVTRLKSKVQGLFTQLLEYFPLIQRLINL